jgi:hypothetical protein
MSHLHFFKELDKMSNNILDIIRNNPDIFLQGYFDAKDEGYSKNRSKFCGHYLDMYVEGYNYYTERNFSSTNDLQYIVGEYIKARRQEEKNENEKEEERKRIEEEKRKMINQEKNIKEETIKDVLNETIENIKEIDEDQVFNYFDDVIGDGGKRKIIWFIVLLIGGLVSLIYGFSIRSSSSGGIETLFTDSAFIVLMVISILLFWFASLILLGWGWWLILTGLVMLIVLTIQVHFIFGLVIGGGFIIGGIFAKKNYD